MGKADVPREKNLSNLKIFTQILNETDIEYFIGFGTLLGYTREQNIIEDDDDIDFLVDVTHYDDILRIIRKLGYYPFSARTGAFVQAQKVMNGFLTRSDFYFYEKHDDHIREKWNFHGKPENPEMHIKIPSSMVYPIVRHEFDGITIPMPADCMSLCRFLYGPRFLEKMSKADKEYEIDIVNNTPVVKYNVPDKPWNEIYRNSNMPVDGSTFAKFVVDFVFEYVLDFTQDRNTNSLTIMDIGCGNGRDSNYFSKNGFQVIGIDGSEEIIHQNMIKHNHSGTKFMCLDVRNIENLEHRSDMIYMRFFIHSIPKDVCSNLLRHSISLINENGHLFIECRSINDPMYGVGEPGPNRDEYINGHYRRFIRKEELLNELKSIGYTIIYECEDTNLSVHKDDNPYLIRVICSK